jgi:hypothetical protein
MPNLKSDATLRAESLEIKDQLKRLRHAVDRDFRGRVAEFVSPHFNGQQHGRSRKPLTGERVLIASVFLSEREGVTFRAFRTESGKLIDAGFTLKEIRFVDSEG